METELSNSKYALISRQVELLVAYDNAGILRSDVDNTADKFLAEPGTLIKIIKTTHESENEKCIVQILNFTKESFILNNLYECRASCLVKVAESFWPFVISIVDPKRRLSLVNNKEQCRFLQHLKENAFVSVQGSLFGNTNTFYDCIIRYIGPVQELSGVGYFFGLELLHLNSGLSPQAINIPFAKKYMQCDPTLSIFTTADWITPIPNELKQKLTAKKILNNTLDRMCTAFAPALNVNNQRTEKRQKKRLPSAQFYDAPSNRCDSDQVNDDGWLALDENLQFSIDDNKNTYIKDTSLANNCGTMNNKDKEIIVINNSDILDSTKNDVIIVNPQDNNRIAESNVDLADLLGTNWPTNAGGAAMILNNRNQLTSKLNDNKLDKFASTTGSTYASLLRNKDEDKREIELPVDVKFNAHSDINSSDFERLCEIPGTKLTVGSLVEVSNSEYADLYGVIRWIGIPPGSSNVMVGIEVEDDPNIRNLSASDGTYNGVRLFQCREGGAIFVPSNKCTNDRRFVEAEGSHSTSRLSADLEAPKFGHVDCPTVLGAVPPIRVRNTEELEDLCGKFKGIQGHHNSCYLDATLFSMFTFTSVFDSILYRKPDAQDIAQYSAVQNVLRDEIVNPLRKNVFTRADRVMKLRKFLDQLSSVSGLTSEEKDPEEFLNSLLSQIMRVEPFLKLSSGQDSYFYQLFVEKDERLTFPTVQQLFEQSFHSSDIKLKEVPSCLIIQMPRFGKNYKMYPRILPSQVLDVTDIIEDSPRQCSVCGKLAEYECRECFGSLQVGSGLECTAFCQHCLKTAHLHAKRANHTSKKIYVPRDFKVMADHMVLPRLYMELFAVVCIETSHYVAFVKAGSGPDAPWCFFDSMADRKGEKNGYNIPEMTSVRELSQWLSDEGARVINETAVKDKVLPEHAKRLFCDAYMCMYQSTDVMMYH